MLVSPATAIVPTQYLMRDHCAIEKGEWINVVFDVEEFFAAEELSVHIHPSIEAFLVHNTVVVSLVDANYIHANFCVEFIGCAAYECDETGLVTDVEFHGSGAMLRWYQQGDRLSVLRIALAAKADVFPWHAESFVDEKAFEEGRA